MLTVRVELAARSYDVWVGGGLTRTAGRLLAGFAGRRLLLVAGRRVRALHGAGLERALCKLGPLAVLELPDGERYKTWRTLARVHDALAAAGVGRDGLLVALGGGVVGDVAGLAAATWMRGLDYVQWPTTLLAMVDASVGGKVAVNHTSGKNLVGAFHQPRAVGADLALLDTLPPRELRSGAYEVLKCALIGAPELWEHLQRLPGDPLHWPLAEREAVVTAAVALKARVVAEDEREGGLRRVLNLGHTFGHALEAATSYRRFTHGEAVGWGLLAAGCLAERRGLLTATQARALERAVERLGPRPGLGGIDSRTLFAAMAHDKKARAGRLVFVLPHGLGAVTLVDDLRPAELRAAWSALRAGRAGG